jgi:HD-GYP domain-containing protein (c-di-GMP phosphodiesterase class II)
VETITDKVSKCGKSLITNLYILVKITKIYDSMNETILNVAKRLLSDLELLLSDTGEVTIKIIEGSFYIEGIRVKAGVSDIESFTFLAEELKKRSIGVFDFRVPIQVEDLINLAYAITSGVEASEVQSKLESALTKGITIGGPVVLQKGEVIDLKDSWAIAKRVYLKAVAAVREMDDTIKAGRRLKLKKIKRALQLIVDCILTEEAYLIGFALSRVYENAYYYHPVNVSILSVALGKRIGFNRIQLRTLAVAAFFHDIGKIKIPLSILNKKTDYTPKEHELLKRHPVDGIKVLLKTLGLNETSILAMLVSLEHHMKLDLSGYPKTFDKRKLNIFSRIISIADEYDSLISGRVYEGKKLGMENARKVMSAGSGTLYDPLLMKAFIGIFA